jgi:predicted RNA binding protein YcfA (HicA-like mRNA interferase family)
MARRPTNYRELRKLLETEEFGYWLARQNGDHYVYKHARQPNFVVPSSPSDIRSFANSVAELKRRHPNASPFATSAKRSDRRAAASKTSPKVRERRRLITAFHHMVRHVTHKAEPVARSRPDRTQCIQCGRPWLSDLDPTERSCPNCGGVVVTP